MRIVHHLAAFILVKTNYSRKFFVFTVLSIINILAFSAVPAFVQTAPEVSAAEFSRIVTEFSETGSAFHTDNWVSNELSYLEVIDAFRRYEIEGGGYIDVGPEQNFTYIAAIKPDIAFLIDIRHQNTMQHLVYKIIFEKSETRAGFLSMLFSISPDTGTVPGEEADAGDLVRYFESCDTNAGMYDETLHTVFNTLKEKYGFILTGRDSSAVSTVLDAFRRHTVNITYRGGAISWYPTLGELLTMSDSGGQYHSPFNSSDDYRYLRRLHIENRIIPVTGDFAGTRALRSIARYLRDHAMIVSAFYVSNVEQYLLEDMRTWNAWIGNVRMLPVESGSVFIRWTHVRGWGNHQTRLQLINMFLANCEAGRYASYDDLRRYDYLR